MLHNCSPSLLSEELTYHKAVLFLWRQVFVCEQPGSLEDTSDALHVTSQAEAVVGQNQELHS